MVCLDWWKGPSKGESLELDFEPKRSGDISQAERNNCSCRCDWVMWKSQVCCAVYNCLNCVIKGCSLHQSLERYLVKLDDVNFPQADTSRIKCIHSGPKISRQRANEVKGGRPLISPDLLKSHKQGSSSTCTRESKTNWNDLMTKLKL